MVASPGDYLWSSYHANAFGQDNKIIICHDEMIHIIRDAINQELVVGSEQFKDKIEETLQRSARRKQAGRPIVKGKGII